jgi:hypothetical protein
MARLRFGSSPINTKAVFGFIVIAVVFYYFVLRSKFGSTPPPTNSLSYYVVTYTGAKLMWGDLNINQDLNAMTRTITISNNSHIITIIVESNYHNGNLFPTYRITNITPQTTNNISYSISGNKLIYYDGKKNTTVINDLSKVDSTIKNTDFMNKRVLNILRKGSNGKYTVTSSVPMPPQPPNIQYVQTQSKPYNNDFSNPTQPPPTNGVATGLQGIGGAVNNAINVPPNIQYVQTQQNTSNTGAFDNSTPPPP